MKTIRRFVEWATAPGIDQRPGYVPKLERFDGLRTRLYLWSIGIDMQEERAALRVLLDREFELRERPKAP